MTWWLAIDLIATVASVAAKLGMVMQIRVNYRRKNVSGLSGTFFVIGFASYFTSGAAGLQHMSLPLLVGQGLGVIPSAVIAWQVVLYRVLPGLGMRMDVDGHFHHHRSCGSCAGLPPELDEVVAARAARQSFPRECDRCGNGLIHRHIQLSPLAHPEERFICDNCGYYGTWTLNDSIWPKAPGDFLPGRPLRRRRMFPHFWFRPVA